MADAPSTTPNPVPESDFDFGEIVKKMGGQWIYDQMGGDTALQQYVLDHPDDLRTLESALGVEEKKLADAAEIKNQSITAKIMLLLDAEFFGSDAKGKSAGTSSVETSSNDTLADQLKDKGKDLTFEAYKTYWKAKTSLEAPLFPDDQSHSIWRGPKLFDGLALPTAMGSKGKDLLKQWPELFPYPAGSRIVLDRSQTDIDKDTTLAPVKTYFESVGLKLVTVASGVTPSTPAADEIQVVRLQDPATMTWDAVKEAQKLWDDTVPTQFEGAPKTLAALQALEEKGPVYSTPEDICKQVGYTNPDVDFLKFLGTVRAAPAAPVAVLAAPAVVSATDDPTP